MIFWNSSLCLLSLLLLFSSGCIKKVVGPPPVMPGEMPTIYQHLDPDELEYWEDNIAFADTTLEANDRTAQKANEDD